MKLRNIGSKNLTQAAATTALVAVLSLLVGSCAQSSSDANPGGQGGGGEGGSASQTCTDPEDCPGQDTTCSQRSCDSNSCGVEYASAGIACSEDGGVACDGAGACIKKSLGSICSEAQECLSAFCVGQHCCESACDGPCDSCGADGLCTCDCGEALSQGPNSPATASTNASIGTKAWSSPENITLDDQLYAEVSGMTKEEISNYLVATNFGFDIPADATILGIEVEFKRTAPGGMGLHDHAVRIVKGGNIGTTDKSLPYNWNPAEKYMPYGGADELWGESWTPAEVNAPNFGAAIAVIYDFFAGTDWAQVNHVRATVHYQLGCP